VGSLLTIYCKFPTEYVDEKIVKIGQYLAKIWTRVSCHPFLTWCIMAVTQEIVNADTFYLSCY